MDVYIDERVKDEEIMCILVDGWLMGKWIIDGTLYMNSWREE